MQLTGKLIMRGAVQQVSDKFSKREFAIETSENPMYPQKIKFELTQDKVELISAFKKDDFITVEFDIRGREWIAPDETVKYFNTLNAWRITADSEAQREAEEGPEPAPIEEAVVTGDNGDDLPF